MVVRWSAGVRSMPGWLIAGALWFGARSGCAFVDESLLDVAGVVGPGAGAGAGAGQGAGGAGTGGSAADAGTASDIDSGMRPPAAGSAAPAVDGSVPPADSGADADANMEEAPPPIDGGAMDAALPDGALPDAGDPPVWTPVPGDYCTQLRPPLATPVIDGELDCGPAAVAITPVGWNGTTTLPSSHSARVAAAWRPNGIYVYVEVTGT